MTDAFYFLSASRAESFTSANGVLDLAGGLFGRTFSLGFGIAGNLADGFLDGALHLVGDALTRSLSMNSAFSWLVAGILVSRVLNAVAGRTQVFAGTAGGVAGTQHWGGGDQ